MMKSLKGTGVLIALICACAALRLAVIDRQGLSTDEFFSLAIATGHSLEHPPDRADPTLGDFIEPALAVRAAAFQKYMHHDRPAAGAARIVRATALSDTNPPLYYLLLGYWMRLTGSTNIALRLFSVLWSVACVPLLWSVAKRVGGDDAAWLSALLFAASPLSVFYGTEGRMYSMLLCLAIAFALATMKLAQRPDVLTWSIWILVGACGMLTHFFFVFVWAPSIAWLAWHSWRSRAALSVSFAIMLCMILPWYALLPRMLSSWRVTADWLNGSYPTSLALGSAAWRLTWTVLSGTGPWEMGDGHEILAIILVLALVIQLVRYRAAAKNGLALLAMSCIGATIGLVLFDVLRGTQTTLYQRYALAGMPAGLVLIGFALSRARAWVRIGGLVVLFFLWFGDSRINFAARSRGGEAFRELATAIPTDSSSVTIVNSIPSGVIGLARYLPSSSMVASWVQLLGRRSMPDDIKQIVRGYNRVTVVRLQDSGAAAPDLEWLESHTKSVNEWQIDSARVKIFEPLQGGVFDW